MIEVETSRNVLDRLGIYAAMGVPEVWRFDGVTLTALLLSPQGVYEPSASSASFPFLPVAAVAGFVSGYDRANDSRWGREFRAWLRREIAPKVRGEDG